jgi:hypothetical protein
LEALQVLKTSFLKTQRIQTCPKAPFGYIEFLRNQFLKTDGPSNGTVFAPVFRN